MKKIINIYFVISTITFACIMNLCCCSTFSQILSSTMITIIIAGLFALFVIKRVDILANLKKMSKVELVMSGYFSAFFAFYLIKGINELFKTGILSNLENPKLLFFVLLGLLFIAMFFAFYGIYYIIHKFIPFIKREIHKSTDSEKKFFIITFLILLVVNILWYSFISKKAIISDDLLYSTDSNYVALQMFPNVIWHLDFRHIFFSILTFPFFSIFAMIRKIIPLHESIYFIFLSMFQVILLLFTAILLKRIMKNDKFMYFYVLSFPTIFYSIIIEKFQLCVFLIVLFIYIRLQDKEERDLEDISLISAVGAITTSAVLGIWSNREKGIKKFQQWLYVALIFIGVSVVFGKWNILITVFDYAKKFGDLPLKNRIYGVTELFASCLFAPLFTIIKTTFIWANRAEYINLLGAGLCILCIYSFIKNRKNKFCQICFSWICFSLFLFLVMNWYCYEAPLFNLYFSWAILGLLFLLLQNILKKLGDNRFIWLGIFILMGTININHMIQIFQFFIKL